jgi:hypothetical protein
MESVTDQVESIRDRFNTKKVFNTSTVETLSNNQVEAIIYIIKHERKDGVYDVDDDIEVILENGACLIKDNTDE